MLQKVGCLFPSAKKRIYLLELYYFLKKLELETRNYQGFVK